MVDNQFATRDVTLQLFGEALIQIVNVAGTASAFIQVPTSMGIIRRIHTLLTAIAGTAYTNVGVEVSDDENAPTALNRIVQRLAIGPGTVAPESIDDFDIDPPRAYRSQDSVNTRRVKVDVTGVGGAADSDNTYRVRLYGDAQG